MDYTALPFSEFGKYPFFSPGIFFLGVGTSKPVRVNRQIVFLYLDHVIGIHVPISCLSAGCGTCVDENGTVDIINVGIMSVSGKDQIHIELQK
ncbi:MAG: 2Fe-2S iron-sulfur cluster-binding protein [Candidatus Natronoplasma sp.]